MFDTRIAVEEVIVDLTAEEISELNAWHDACDAEWSEREALADAISDYSKDVCGCRVRIPWATMTMDELREEYEHWVEALRRERERDADDAWYDAVLPPVEPVPVCEWDDLYKRMGW